MFYWTSFYYVHFISYKIIGVWTIEETSFKIFYRGSFKVINESGRYTTLKKISKMRKNDNNIDLRKRDNIDCLTTTIYYFDNKKYIFRCWNDSTVIQILTMVCKQRKNNNTLIQQIKNFWKMKDDSRYKVYKVRNNMTVL